MKYIKYKYNNNLKDLTKVIIKREQIKNPLELVNKNIKIEDIGGNKKIKKVLGIELMPLDRYNSTLDKLTTNNYYSNSNGVDIEHIKNDFNCYDNKIIILTIN